MTESKETIDNSGLELLEDTPTNVIVTPVGKFTVLPIKMGKLKRFSKLAIPMFEEIMACLESESDIIPLIENHEDDVIEIIGLCSNFTRADYEEIFPDDFMTLALAVFEVNTDFFVRNLIPKVKDRIEGIKVRLETMKHSTGQIKSSASEATGTA